MALKELRVLRKNVDQKKDVIRKVDYLIVGDNLFSYYSYYLLKKKFSENSIKVIVGREGSANVDVFKGPSIARGPENLKALQSLFPDKEIKEIDKSSTYYKDQQFKKFKNKSIYNELLMDEVFFIEKRFDLKYAEIFPFLSEDEPFQTTFKEESLKIDVLKIEKKEDGSFLIELSDGNIFDAKFLIWGESPKHFIDLCKNKNGFDNYFIEFCEKTSPACGLYVKYSFEKKVSEITETFFLPVSATNKWGHFIGEFDEQDKNGQSIEFVHFLDELDSNEEEVAKRIKILKKALEKIFPAISFDKAREYITLGKRGGCLKIDDSLFYAKNRDEEKIFFVGCNAPVEVLDTISENFMYSLESITHLSRGLFSIELLKKSLLN